MDKFQIAVETINEIATEAAETGKEIRPLQDAELMLAGGGDGGVIWG